MHRPPAVSHTASRSLRHLYLLLGCLVAGLCVLALFFLSGQPLWWLIAIAWLFSAAWALHAWWTSPAGLLQWDGECWHWTVGEEGQACSVRMVWDLQSLVLVRTVGLPHRGRWLWLEPGPRALQWNALRRALVSADTQFTDASPSLT